MKTKNKTIELLENIAKLCYEFIQAEAEKKFNDDWEKLEELTKEKDNYFNNVTTLNYFNNLKAIKDGVYSVKINEKIKANDVILFEKDGIYIKRKVD